MSTCNAYESPSMQDVTGQTLRPGGFSLTEKAVEFCGIFKGDRVLDLGCGMGATIGYLHEKHEIKGVGIDPSKKLLDVGRKKFASSEFILGTGDYLPFAEKSMDCVFAECTLSLMDNINKTINEVFKVLKNDGSFVITDVYARNSTGIKALEDFSFNSCMRGLHDIEHLKEMLVTRGFEIMLFEDCSDLLKELMVKIIFSYGSMDIFWRKATENSDCTNGRRFQEILKACKPGYFMIIAKKGNK